MRQRALIVLVVWLCLLPILQGCNTAQGGSAIRELSQLNVVLATGIDYDERKKQFVVTIQSMKPAKEKNKPVSPDAVYTATASGNTVIGAARNLRAFTSGTLVWFHAKTVVLGKDVLKDDRLKEIIDFLARNREIRYSSWILVADRAAKDIIIAKPNSEVTISDEILGLINNQAEFSRTATIMLRDVINKYIGPESTFVTGIIRKSPVSGKKEVVEILGGAVIKNGNYAGELTPREMRTLRWMNKITGKELESIISFPLHKDKDKKEYTTAAQLQITGRRQKVEIVNGIPHISIELESDATIMETGTDLDLTDPATEEKIKQAMNHFIQRNVQHLLNKMQKEKRTDVFSFYKLVHQQQKEYWYEHEKEWGQIYPQIPVTFSIKWGTIRMGLIPQIKRGDGE